MERLMHHVAHRSTGGVRTLFCQGVFTLARLEASVDGTVWVSVSDATTMTEPGMANFTLQAGLSYRIHLEGSDGDTRVWA